MTNLNIPEDLKQTIANIVMHEAEKKEAELHEDDMERLYIHDYDDYYQEPERKEYKIEIKI